MYMLMLSRAAAFSGLGMPSHARTCSAGGTPADRERQRQQGRAMQDVRRRMQPRTTCPHVPLQQLGCHAAAAPGSAAVPRKCGTRTARRLAP
jgi:hypothetical protein